MASDAPTTVEAYLAALPEERRALVSALREAVNAHLPAGYAEGIQYGMIGWFVPHALFPAGYHCDPKQPLPFAGLASQKSSVSLHLMFLYGNAAETEAFVAAWKATGKKLDMGKACVRVKRLADVPLEVVGVAIARVPVATYIARYQATLSTRT
jgi:hypothetical protein